MDRIDWSQRGVEKFLLLKALHGLKKERVRQAGRQARGAGKDISNECLRFSSSSCVSAASGGYSRSSRL